MNSVTLARVIVVIVVASVLASLPLLGALKEFFPSIGLGKIETNTILSILCFFCGVSITYIIVLLETVRINQKSKTKTCSELIHSQDELFDKLIKDTVDSKEVYTHMLSEPPEKITENAKDYFYSVNNKIKNGKIAHFSRIASVNSKEKALWVIEILSELIKCRSYSMAIKYFDHKSPMNTVHICVNDDRSSVYVWPTLVPGGVGKSFVVKNTEIAQGMKNEHRREFDHSIILKSGAEIYWDNIDSLVRKYNIENEKCCVELMTHK